MSTFKMFILYVSMFHLQIDSICVMSLNDDNELELCNVADNDMFVFVVAVSRIRMLLKTLSNLSAAVLFNSLLNLVRCNCI